MPIRRTLAALFVLVIPLAAPAVAAAGTLVVANKSDATVSLVDTGSGEVVATLPTGEGPHEVAVSPDGKTALVANYGTRGAPGSSLTVIDLPGLIWPARKVVERLLRRLNDVVLREDLTILVRRQALFGDWIEDYLRDQQCMLFKELFRQHYASRRPPAA